MSDQKNYFTVEIPQAELVVCAPTQTHYGWRSYLEIVASNPNADPYTPREVVNSGSLIWKSGSPKSNDFDLEYPCVSADDHLVVARAAERGAVLWHKYMQWSTKKREKAEFWTRKVKSLEADKARIQLETEELLGKIEALRDEEFPG